MTEAAQAQPARTFDFSGGVLMATGDVAAEAWAMARRHMEAEWNGDLDATMATMTRNDPFQIMHATGLHIIGWNAVRDFYAERFRTFSGQGFFSRRWIVSGDAIAGVGYFRGAPLGRFFGIQATGLPLCLPMSVWFYLEGGLIKGESAFLDGHELRRQLLEGTDRDHRNPLF